MTRDEVVQKLRDMIGADYKQKDMARDAGVSRVMISAVLTGRKAPPPKVLALLGLRRVVRYVPEVRA